MRSHDLMRGLGKVTRRSVMAVALGATVLGAGAAQAAEKINIAALTFVSSSPLFIAKEKGYFDAEGLDAELTFFRSAQPVAVAIASGDADFGVTAFTGGFFNLRSEEHTSELQSHHDLVCRLLLEKKKKQQQQQQQDNMQTQPTKHI